MLRSAVMMMAALALLSSCAPPATAAQRQSVSPAPAIVPLGAQMVVVATPTAGPDYNATRSAIDIQAAANRAAGDEAFRLAGEAELDAQRAIATIQAQQVAATASHAETMAAIQATQGAELHAIAGEGTRAAIEIEVSAAQGAATRQARAQQTAQAEQAIEQKHAAALREKERIAEQRAADWKEYTRPLLAIAPGILVLAFCITAACMLMRLALARDVVADFLALVERLTGNFDTTINGTAYPVDSTALVPGSKVMAQEDGDLLQLLIYAVKADCFQFDTLTQGGYPSDKKKWVRLMARLQRDGWAVKINVGGSVDKWIVRRDSQGADIPIHEILTSYRTAFQTMGPAPSPSLTRGMP